MSVITSHRTLYVLSYHCNALSLNISFKIKGCFPYLIYGSIRLQKIKLPDWLKKKSSWKEHDDLRTKKLNEEADIFVIHDFEEEITNRRNQNLFKKHYGAKKPNPTKKSADYRNLE